MKLRNLETNILYRVCEELTRGGQCGPVDTDLIYRSYADLPFEKVAASLQVLIDRGWLQADQRHSKIYLTDRGRSEIRAFIPARLLSACEPPTDCLPP